MAICLIHNSRIVDEGYRVREETQILLLPLSPFSISCRGSIQLRVVPFRSSRAHSQHVRWKKEIGNCDPHWALPHLTVVIRRHVPKRHWCRHGNQTGRMRHNTKQQQLFQHVRGVVLSDKFCFIDLLCEILDGVLIGSVSHHPRLCCHRNRHH